jgi:hypothetical protein
VYGYQAGLRYAAEVLEIETTVVGDQAADDTVKLQSLA